LCVDPIVLPVRADEPDIEDPIGITNPNYNAMLVAVAAVGNVSTINGAFVSNGGEGRPGTSRSSTTTEDDAMIIKRKDLDAGRIDFADVSTGKRLPLIHPGEILSHDFLRPMKVSVYTLAQAIKVPRSRINDIVLGRRGVTADTAFRLARYFGTSPDFWINLQARCDLDAAERKLRRRIEREVRPRAA
jgi:addiction module HigA family antidote